MKKNREISCPYCQKKSNKHLWCKCKKDWCKCIWHCDTYGENFNTEKWFLCYNKMVENKKTKGGN